MLGLVTKYTQHQFLLCIFDQRLSLRSSHGGVAAWLGQGQSRNCLGACLKASHTYKTRWYAASFLIAYIRDATIQMPAPLF